MADELKTLQPWEEIQGLLQCVNVKENNGIIILDFGHERVSMPFNLQLKHELETKTGRSISILRTDIEETPYLLMEGD